jgi:hypothetical protein
LHILEARKREIDVNGWPKWNQALWSWFVLFHHNVYYLWNWICRWEKLSNEVYEPIMLVKVALQCYFSIRAQD